MLKVGDPCAVHFANGTINGMPVNIGENEHLIVHDHYVTWYKKGYKYCQWPMSVIRCIIYKRPSSNLVTFEKAKRLVGQEVQCLGTKSRVDSVSYISDTHWWFNLVGDVTIRSNELEGWSLRRDGQTLEDYFKNEA